MKAIILTYLDLEQIDAEFPENDSFLSTLKADRRPHVVLLDLRGMSGMHAFDVLATAERHIRDLGLSITRLVRVSSNPTAQSLCHGSGLAPNDCVIWRRRSLPQIPCDLVSRLQGPISVQYIG